MALTNPRVPASDYCAKQVDDGNKIRDAPANEAKQQAITPTRRKVGTACSHGPFAEPVYVDHREPEHECHYCAGLLLGPHSTNNVRMGWRINFPRTRVAPSAGVDKAVIVGPRLIFYLAVLHHDLMHPGIKGMRI